MKVNKVVGWLQGRNGTGNVFEVERDGKLILAMIWEDNKFHGLGVADLLDHIKQGKAQLNESAEKYQPFTNFPENADGSISVENPAGWQRLYTAPGTQEPEEEETGTDDELVFPISVSFSGSVKIKLGGISKLLKFIE